MLWARIKGKRRFGLQSGKFRGLLKSAPIETKIPRLLPNEKVPPLAKHFDASILQ